MRTKTFASALLLALAVAVPALPAVSATAAPAAHSASVQADAKGSGKTAKAAKAKKAKKAKKAAKAKKAFNKFNLGGLVTAVDGATVTFTVRGGKEKALRGTSLTVTVAENARILRNDGPATLADFVVGDRVRAKGTKVDGVYTAKRIKAVSQVDDEPETPTPAPEPEPEPEPDPVV